MPEVRSEPEIPDGRAREQRDPQLRQVGRRRGYARVAREVYRNVDSMIAVKESSHSRSATRYGSPAGEVAFALGGVPHTLPHQSAEAARVLVVCAPAGFEREFGRRAAAIAGIDPPV